MEDSDIRSMEWNREPRNKTSHIHQSVLTRVSKLSNCGKDSFFNGSTNHECQKNYFKLIYFDKRLI